MTQKVSRPAFNYDPKQLERELLKFYLGPKEQEIKEMLKDLGLNTLEDLYSHIRTEVKFSETPDFGPELNYEDLADHLYEVSLKNNIRTSFLGDGLAVVKEADIVSEICGIRGLTTAYTPYQPERSQGTLQSLWIYQSSISQVTGFEAINASFYERSTCLYEAINTSLRITKKSDKVLISEAIYPQDLKVLKTQKQEINNEFILIPIDKKTGLTDLKFAKDIISKTEGIASIVFPQVNTFGLLEDVDALTDFATENSIQSIVIFDPALLSNNGLKQPAKYGSNEQGCSMIVGEGQHLALSANYGGPGLGIFGIRYNQESKLAIRQTAGRYIGKTVDAFGRECKSIILSTREQHIRREKATSNICSNQSFVASLAGACLLRKGHEGLDKSLTHALSNAQKVVTELLKLDGVKLAFSTASFTEFTFSLSKNIAELITSARGSDLWAGVDLTNRCNDARNLIKISFNDTQSEADLEKLINFFKSQFKTGNEQSWAKPKANCFRKDSYKFPELTRDEIIAYYNKLGKQNFSPDDGIYPLGSCTMKYNPYINDWAAGLRGFTQTHPQAPIEDVQGNMEVLFETQELFKKITGLPALTTQPVAGAQGELVGLKMFQAYHRRNGEADTRNIILIPKSAHGTNPATATMAGFVTKKVDGVPQGIYLIDANEKGEFNLEQIKEVCALYPKNIAGVMVTNPNTAGVFESKFKELSELIHSIGGLVYMDGANMNAIASVLDLDALGVDAVHSNLHKTWSIPHGGGGPGDAIVAVSEKLIDFLPGHQIVKENGIFKPVKTKNSIGEFHRHWGNFAHKVRCYTYIKALGSEGTKMMAQVAVLCARYLHHHLKSDIPTLPFGAESTPRMHEFILTLKPETFEKLAATGIPKTQAIAKVGKLFLDFGFHAPTVAFPEVFGLMVEPTESFSKVELDDFIEMVKGVYHLINEKPEILLTVPHFTPVGKVNEVEANKKPQLSEDLSKGLSEILNDRYDTAIVRGLKQNELFGEILKAHQASL
jgi:glycine dehydrogenase